ncbi:MAG: enoyl-CoA hydratase-related protein [Burkholderiaceae bacterium]|nr:enoyl-CoA hydratase-related protein [Burkholderiaceae bacterium]
MNEHMPTVLYREMDGVAIIRLNRPLLLNAMNSEMLLGLTAAIDSAREDTKVRAVLLAATGRGFCAGAELAHLSDSEPADAGETLRRYYHPVVLGMRGLPKPIVVAVNGVAAGAGLSLVLAADVVIASREAKFCAAFSRIGLVPDSGCTYFLPRIVGDMRARALVLLAERIGAEEAKQQGLVWKVTAPELLDTEALELAKRFAAMPTRALGLAKEALEASHGANLEQQLELEARLQSEAALTSDFAEGVSAFLEKRSPVFLGS